MNTITLTQPDDWHAHLRDGLALERTVPDLAQQFARAICMPNLVPPVKTVDEAIAYRNRIMQHVPEGNPFDPRMVLYFTDQTLPSEIAKIKASDCVNAIKLYPAGATTNSDNGVSDIRKVYAVIEEMEKHQIPLLLHGEVTHKHVDIFDREKRFLDEVLSPLIQQFPDLKIVLEHITTSDAANFVLEQSKKVAATITPQHLLFNRNDMLVGGIKPHFYCLPILKRQTHQSTLLDVATSGSPKFFLGTDSAPHAQDAKENACGCAGCYSAPTAIELYAQAFDQVGKIDRLEGFASHFGADFYGLPRNTSTITLKKEDQVIPASLSYLEDQQIIPLYAGQTIQWRKM
ncbi:MULTISPECIES: dihydroorotase [Acinetobacter]|uniref:Dihydroorotase n=1 Tax=Acinetobacter pollinis TaxID=2605270 RepID=A0ABU6DPI7_9GAMM|nr:MULTISPECIES: dihydroorotase [Acinetobacter]MBF7690192.1 dihydroorotase [Acinetobacter pollinis]MBF7693526.1 dihydroorotase [Acinetobacter pollinis]MBF7697724.1 dihydroorotase [Acinetobacter pollinis]MBF7699526.1 dihydroorotase [Acinetobacter pollinis]MEB5475764.1 dihydroorotase [Acinetobacter pollinis]